MDKKDGKVYIIFLFAVFFRVSLCDIDSSRNKKPGNTSQSTRHPSFTPMTLHYPLVFIGLNLPRNFRKLITDTTV